MKTTTQIGTILITAVSLLLAGGAFAQPTPPPLPPGQLLNVWPFSGTNYLSLRRTAPLSLTNVALVPTWDGNGLLVDSTNAAWITYAVVETNGHTNLDCSQGSVETWYMPSSTNRVANWGTLLEVGTWSTNATGAWGLYLDSSNICFAAQSNGFSTNYLSAPINWKAGEWHHIMLTYSATNSSLYLEGQLITNGPGISIVPGPDVISNGFSIGSDGNPGGTGLRQAHGVYNQLISYNYQVDADTIAENYDYDTQYVFPLPSSGGLTMTTDTDSGPPTPPGGGGSDTNSGGGTTYYAPQYGSNDFWIEPLSPSTNTADGVPVLTLLVHATKNNSTYAPVYELLWTDDLTPPVNWEVLETFVGATNTNATALTVPLFSDSSAAFFRVVNIGTNGDSSGVGLPDSWQLAYFGYVGVDPFGDPAGDGYDNLYKYEHGMNPNTFYTPAAPSGFSAALNTNGNIVVSWQPSAGLPNSGAGALTNYTLNATNNDAYDDPLNAAINPAQSSYTIPASSDSALLDTLQLPLFYSLPQYMFQANYANTNSLWAGNQPPFNLNNTVNAKVVRGSQGALYLLASAIPSSVTAIRVLVYETDPMSYPENNFANLIQYLNNADNYGTPIPSNSFLGVVNYFDVPVNSFTNGVYQIPDSILPLYGAYFLITSGIGSDGFLGNLVIATPTNDWSYYNGELNPPYSINGPIYYTYTYQSVSVPFIDARSAIQQNINFLLRAASDNSPFSLQIDYFYGNWYGAHSLQYPSNYVYSGFSFQGTAYDDASHNYSSTAQRDEFAPFEDNYLYSHFAYRPDVYDDSGYFTNYFADPGWFPALSSQDPATIYPTLDFVTNHSTQFPAVAPAPSLYQQSEDYIVSVHADPWTLSQYPTTDGCLYNSDGSLTLLSGAKNIYGLPIDGVEYFSTNNVYQGASGGQTFVPNGYGYLFHSTVIPQLSTVGYYFARPNVDPLPGQSTFSPTNASPSPFIIPFGQPFFLTAWAQQSVVNGYSGVYAFPQQYFDKAFFADANGNITTNETGILSEYGEFFPTQPGKVFLTTKPDAATGSVGTNVVNVIKLQLDVNHDSTMDLSFAGPDNTSADRPFVFWVNNDSDVPTKDLPTGEDISDPSHPDYSRTNIPSQRDLEDWARLWICGLPNLSTNYQVTLSWNVISGSPAINLVNPVETNGGTLYLTDTNIAARQAEGDNPFALSYKFASVTPSQPFTFWPGYMTWNTTNCFLFEGAGIGKGELVLTISQNGTNLASTSAFIDLHDVKDFYERAIITNMFEGGAITNMTFGLLKVEPPAITQENEDTNIIVYAHGADNNTESWLSCSDTIFKRLYWSGYRGRFSSVRWPSPPLSLEPYGFAWFNSSEYIGYKSAVYLKNYATNLQTRFPGYNIHMWAHSAGGHIATEALSEGAPFKSLVLSAVTVSAGCYDINAPTNSGLLSAESWSATPEWQPWGYHGAYTNLSANVFNYFNTNDDLLNKYWLGVNQKLFKPASGYHYNGTNSDFYVADPNGHTVAYYPVTDPQESRAMVARSRTAAIGAQGPSVGQTKQGVISSTVNAGAQFGLGRTDPEHGAFFMRAIQSIRPYYIQVLTSIKPPQ